MMAAIQVNQKEAIDSYFASLKESGSAPVSLTPSALTTDFVSRARRQYVRFITDLIGVTARAVHGSI